MPYLLTLLRVEGMTSERDPLLILHDRVRSPDPLGRQWLCESLPHLEDLLSLVANLANCVLDQRFAVGPFADLLPNAISRRAEDLPTEINRIVDFVGRRLADAGFGSLAEELIRAFPPSVISACQEHGSVESGGWDPEETRRFIEALLEAYRRARLAFVGAPSLYKVPPSEVLELLIADDVGVYGINIHTSTGSTATFTRNESGTEAVNFAPGRDGIEVIAHGEPRDGWWIGDNRLHQVGLPGRYNPMCEWRPLVYEGETSGLRREAVEASDNEDVQGAMFYMLCTGHRVLEFAAKMEVELPSRAMVVGSRIHLYNCTPTQEDEPRPTLFVYDGWVDLNSGDAAEVSSALDAVARLFNRTAVALDCAIAWRPKYSFRPNSGGAWLGDNIDDLNALLTGYPEGADAEAVDVAVDWYNRASGSTNPFTRFLCYYIAIESIVHAIYDGDAHFELGIVTPNKAKRREQRRRCISEYLESLYSEDPEEFVRRAYFDCLIGSTARTKSVISLVFGAESTEYNRLFAYDEGPSLAELRSHLAHGLLSELSPDEAKIIRTRTGEVRAISRSFLLRLLLKLRPDEDLPASLQQRGVSMSLQDPRNTEIASNLDMFPTKDWSIRPEWISWS